MTSSKFNEKITEDFVRKYLSDEAKTLAVKMICSTKPGDIIFEGYSFNPTLIEIYEILLHIYQVSYIKKEKGIHIYFIRK